MRPVRPTINDVAELSGVGKSTVSRVLNANPHVSEDARRRVLQAIEQLHYRANLQARVLSGGRGQTIVWAYPTGHDIDVNSFFNASFEIGAMRAASQEGYQLVMIPLNPFLTNRTGALSDVIASVHLDGVILTPPFCDDAELIEWLQASHVPVACVVPGLKTRHLANGVGIDDEQAGYDLAHYMIGLGHRRFAYVKGRLADEAAGLRYDGFCRAMRSADLDPAQTPTWRGNFQFRSGYQIAGDILGLDTLPSAILCANDDMAAGVMFRLHEAGIGVPDCVSVAGFDNTQVSEVIWPPLTTIDQPVAQMGQKAVAAILRAIRCAGPESAFTYEVIPHTLILRASTRAIA